MYSIEGDDQGVLMAVLIIINLQICAGASSYEHVVLTSGVPVVQSTDVVNITPTTGRLVHVRFKGVTSGGGYHNSE